MYGLHGQGLFTMKNVVVVNSVVYISIVLDIVLGWDLLKLL